MSCMSGDYVQQGYVSEIVGHTSILFPEVLFFTILLIHISNFIILQQFDDRIQ